MIGKTLAHYEVTERIGAGGMGEVYRAHDTKLGRDVALKLLPESFAADTERLARFEREAKLLAGLNHTNIAAIYGVEESDSQRFLVLELVEGMVHRDLKPANVMVSPDGTDKVLNGRLFVQELDQLRLEQIGRRKSGADRRGDHGR